MTFAVFLGRATVGRVESDLTAFPGTHGQAAGFIGRGAHFLLSVVLTVCLFYTCSLRPPLLSVAVCCMLALFSLGLTHLSALFGVGLSWHCVSVSFFDARVFSPSSTDNITVVIVFF